MPNRNALPGRGTEADDLPWLRGVLRGIALATFVVCLYLGGVTLWYLRF